MSTIEDQAVPIEVEVLGGVSESDGQARVALSFKQLDFTLFYEPEQARYLARLMVEAADHADTEALTIRNKP